MKHYINDTTAAITTAISTSAAVIHFTKTWGPVLSFAVGIVSFCTGILAAIYYTQKVTRRNDGKQID
jgi:hypothetical protein